MEKKEKTIFVPRSDTQLDFKGNTLLLPTVTIGNLGQLTVDLLLSKYTDQKEEKEEEEGEHQSLSMVPVGYFYDACLLPAVGNDPFSTQLTPTGRLAVNVEVFQDAKAGITIVQQRAPVVENQNQNYALKIQKWVESAGFARVILLTSSDASFCSAPFRSEMGYHLIYTSTKPFEANPALGWKNLEQNQPLPEAISAARSLAAFLYEGFLKTEIPFLLLTKFTLESPENVSEAQFIAHQLCSFFGWKDSESGWTLPASWGSLFVESVDAIPERLFF